MSRETVFVTSMNDWEYSVARKAFSALLMYGVFGATQGVIALLRVAPRFAPASLVRDHPWISAYDHHWWQLVVSVALLACFSRGHVSAWGLNFSNWRLSLKLFARFTIPFTAIVILYNVLPRYGPV